MHSIWSPPRAGPDPPAGPPRRPIVDPAVAAVFGLPGFVDACFGLSDRLLPILQRPGLLPLVDSLVRNQNCLLVAGCCTAAYFCARMRVLSLEPYARATIGHPDLDRARAAYPFYAQLILTHPRMLAVPPGEMAGKVGISPRLARFLYQNPGFVPRQDVLAKICDALLVPTEWLHGQRGYGYSYTIERLARYHRLGLADAWTWEKIAAATHRTRASALSAIERRLISDMSREGGRHA